MRRSLWILLVMSLATAENCMGYQCLPPSEPDLPTSQCTFVSGNTVYLQECDNGGACDIESGKCIGDSSSVDSAWPGEPCSDKIPCLSGKCKGGYCEGQAMNATCTYNTDCNPGLYCNSEICSLQVETDGPCLSEYDCVNYAGCTRGSCVEYFSLANGAEVDGCEEGFMYHNLCESFACYRGKCVSTIRSLAPTPTNCTSEFDCMGRSQDSPTTYFSTCECGFNPWGQSYCSLFPGDPDVQNAKFCLKNWLFGEMSRQCNTERRFADYCIKSFWDEPDYTELQVYIFRASFYPKLAYNDDCVQEMLTDFYWDVIDSHDDWAEWLILTSAVVFL